MVLLSPIAVRITPRSFIFSKIRANAAEFLVAMLMLGSNCKLYGFKLGSQLRLCCEPLYYSKIQANATEIAIVI